MHMADALISPAVGGAMIAVSGASLAWSIRKDRGHPPDDRKIPLMGVMSAFVFAAQMVNFTIPGTGSSGHIGGGILLAALLGGGPALLCITAVLAIQCLLFADGGLLALGCNLFNMGVVPCLVAYPLIYRPIAGNGGNRRRLTVASVAAAVAGLQLGALAVVGQTTLSGISHLPIGAFLMLMQPIHLAIGVAEGLITAAVLLYVGRARPELLKASHERRPLPAGAPLKRVLVALAALTLVVGGGLSLLASSHPDGLEWSIGGALRQSAAAGDGELAPVSGGAYDAAAGVQRATAVMPDYAFKDSEAGTSVAGVVGSGAVLLVAAGSGLLAARLRRRAR
ncbi:MAG: cobalamin biosynthesis protein CbiM [Clostridiales bacterium]|nr:cobalamin biosynthesis protein CbiM [Clostridiales bacterium]